MAHFYPRHLIISMDGVYFRLGGYRLVVIQPEEIQELEQAIKDANESGLWDRPLTFMESVYLGQDPRGWSIPGYPLGWSDPVTEAVWRGSNSRRNDYWKFCFSSGWKVELEQVTGSSIPGTCYWRIYNNSDQLVWTL